MSKRPVFLMKFVRAKTISGPNKPIMAAYEPDLKDWVFALFWLNFQDTGLVRVFHTGKCWSPHVFHHPRAIEINTFWKSHTGCPNCHLPASKQKGLNSNKRLHFPTRRSKVRIHFGFQVPIAAAFCANPEPWPCPFIDISWHGLLLVRLDLWCSLHFIVGQYMTSQAWQGKCTHKMKVYWKKSSFFTGELLFW